MFEQPRQSRGADAGVVRQWPLGTTPCAARQLARGKAAQAKPAGEGVQQACRWRGKAVRGPAAQPAALNGNQPASMFIAPPPAMLTKALSALMDRLEQPLPAGGHSVARARRVSAPGQQAKRTTQAGVQMQQQQRQQQKNTHRSCSLLSYSIKSSWLKQVWAAASSRVQIGEEEEA